MSNVYNFSSTIIPSIIVGITALILDLTNNISTKDKILYIDIVLNIVSFLSSRFIVLNFANFFSTDILFQYYLDIICEPCINGIFLGLMYKFGFKHASLTRFKENLYKKYSIIGNNTFTFESGLAKGFMIDLISNYLDNPLVKVS